jgi:hypothetical protein
MIDVSTFGSGITILSTNSFPNGFMVSTFADDSDPLSIKETETSGYEPLYDGSIFVFDKTAPVELSLSVISGSDDDINLKILLQARKGGIRLLPLKEFTTMVINYPGNGRVILSAGSIVKGPMADSMLTNGRRKGNTYSFVFGTFAGAQSAKELITTVARIGATFL